MIMFSLRLLAPLFPPPFPPWGGVILMVLGECGAAARGAVAILLGQQQTVGCNSARLVDTYMQPDTGHDTTAHYCCCVAATAHRPKRIACTTR